MLQAEVFFVWHHLPPFRRGARTQPRGEKKTPQFVLFAFNNNYIILSRPLSWPLFSSPRRFPRGPSTTVCCRGCWKHSAGSMGRSLACPLGATRVVSEESRRVDAS
jgi:hypothetical protein